jgi:hypothetical protein
MQPRLLREFEFDERIDHGAPHCLGHRRRQSCCGGSATRHCHHLRDAIGCSNRRRVGLEPGRRPYQLLPLGQQPNQLSVDGIDTCANLGKGLWCGHSRRLYRERDGRIIRVLARRPVRCRAVTPIVVARTGTRPAAHPPRAEPTATRGSLPPTARPACLPIARAPSSINPRIPHFIRAEPALRASGEGCKSSEVTLFSSAQGAPVLRSSACHHGISKVVSNGGPAFHRPTASNTVSAFSRFWYISQAESASRSGSSVCPSATPYFAGSAVTMVWMSPRSTRPPMVSVPA